MPDPLPAAVRVGPSALAVTVRAPRDIPAALAALGVAPRPVIVLVGGADDVSAEDLRRLRPLFDDALLPVASQQNAAVVDGGTRAGVMRALGEGLARGGTDVLLIGVAVGRTVRVPGVGGSAPDAADLEPHHTHFVLVPGDGWGDESPWLARVAGAVADGFPAVTVAVNGGDITLDDVENSVSAGRPVIVVRGSGRTADDLAAAVDGTSSDERLRGLAATGLVDVVVVDDPAGLARALTAALTVASNATARRHLRGRSAPPRSG